ncbi:MAG: hypothetical protein OXL96_28230 [Candidatus Poribacteria bacterium]|nr:hypothetical protein [Candidatus Poribacteria bacterium]
MPVSVNIAPNIQTTQTSNFHFTIVLSISESQVLDPDSFTIANNIRISGSQDVDDDDFSVVSVSGNDVVIGVRLPTTETSGSFVVRVRGVVTIDGVEKQIDTTRKRINYDTFTSLSAVFGKPSYRGAGELAIPVTFAEDVIAPSQTIFSLTHIAGAAVSLIDAYIVGATREYELILLLPRDSKGLFTIAAAGTVFKTFSGTYDSVTLTRLLVPWTYLFAEISVLGEPKEISKGIFEVEIETDLPTKSLNINTFSYKISTASRVLFRSNDVSERPSNPPLLSKTDIAEPACFESWDRVVDNTNEPSGRFFLLRFKREYPNETTLPEILFTGGDLESSY